MHTKVYVKILWSCACICCCVGIMDNAKCRVNVIKQWEISRCQQLHRDSQMGSYQNNLMSSAWQKPNSPLNTLSPSLTCLPITLFLSDAIMLVHWQSRQCISSFWLNVAAAPLGHDGGGLGSMCAANVGQWWMQMRLCSLWCTLCIYPDTNSISYYHTLSPHCLPSHLSQGPEATHTILHHCLNHDNKVHLALSCQTPTAKMVALLLHRHAD